MNPVSSHLQSSSILSEHPLKILEHLANSWANGCFFAQSPTVEWRFYFHQGQLTYGTHSVEPLERLERHLSTLSKQNSLLTARVRQQARQLFAPTRSGTEHSYQTADYQATHWLIEQQLLKKSEASLLSKSLLEETLETYLMLPRVSYKLVNFPFTPLAQFPTNILLQGCQNRLRAWQKLSDKINSSYQRLYLADQVNSSQNLPTNQREKLKKILIGFNFRQLALLTSQDELVLAQNLYPLIRQGTIIVKAPAPPFDKLPSFSTVNHAEASLTPKTEINSPRIAPKAQKTINIVCVDDSPAMLKAIAHFLRNQEVEIFTISDPLKALREIIRLEPKLILLDVGMPNLDGYHLSRLIRKHS